MEFSLNSKYFANISKFANGDKSCCDQRKSIIINNDYKIEMPAVVAAAVSSKLTNLLEIDRTANSLMINIKAKSNINTTLDKIKRAIVFQENVSITEEEIPILASFGIEIGNEDFLKPSVAQINRISEELDKNSVVDLIKMKRALHMDDFSKEVDFIAENFSQMEENEEFIKFSSDVENIDIVEDIISNDKIKLENEDHLLSFILEISKSCDNKKAFFRLFSHVFLEYCSIDKCKEFLDFVNDAIQNQEINYIISCVGRRLLQPKLPIDKKYMNGRHMDTVVDFDSSAGKYNGVIKYLSDKYNGNIYSKGVIDIKASSTHDNSERYKIEHVVQEKGNWGSNNYDEDTWIMFDFKNRKVAVNGYTMRSNESVWGDYNRSWVLEGSNDSNSWALIDQQTDQECLEGDNKEFTYHCSLSDNFRYLRIKRVGKSWHEHNFLTLNRIEFFGNIIE